MVDWVVDEVPGKMVVEEDSNRGGDSRLSLHLELELSKEAGLLPSHGKRHVLAFARAQAGIPTSFDCQLTASLADKKTKAARERPVSGQVRWLASQ